MINALKDLFALGSAKTSSNKCNWCFWLYLVQAVQTHVQEVL